MMLTVSTYKWRTLISTHPNNSSDITQSRVKTIFWCFTLKFRVRWHDVDHTGEGGGGGGQEKAASSWISVQVIWVFSPSQVPQPTCYRKWHSWQLGNLTNSHPAPPNYHCTVWQDEQHTSTAAEQPFSEAEQSSQRRQAASSKCFVGQPGG